MNKKRTIFSCFIILTLTITFATIYYNFSYNNSIYGKANNFDITENNIIKMQDMELETIAKTLNDLRTEFCLLYENKDYKTCTKILNKLNDSGIAILLTDSYIETSDGIQLYSRYAYKIFDLFEEIGWDNIKWSDEKQEFFFNTIFVYGYNDQIGKSECRRKVFEKHLTDYKNLPKEIKKLIPLNDTELSKAENFRENLLREMAIKEAVQELREDLHSPNSLDVHYETCLAYNSDENTIKVIVDYSAMNLFGGMPRNKYYYTYKIDPIYPNWNFNVQVK